MGPMPHVMPFGDPDGAAREAAGLVPMLERPPQRGRYRPCSGPDFHHPPVPVMTHHHPAGIARQALRRFRGSAHPVLEDRLAGLVGVGQHGGIDVDDDLVALARGAGIEVVMQGSLGEAPARLLSRPAGCGPGGRSRGSRWRRASRR